LRQAFSQLQATHALARPSPARHIWNVGQRFLVLVGFIERSALIAQGEPSIQRFVNTPLFAEAFCFVGISGSDPFGEESGS
jgi:hypothetical protein